MPRSLPDNYAPYAPAAPVLDIIRRKRERGLPNPVTAQSLESIGVSSGNARHVMGALRFLGLVEEGQATDRLDRLARATTEEYPEVLAEIVRAAYAPVFAITKPGEDTEIRLNDAFRPYNPPQQRERMVRLFLSLCREAGIVQGGPAARISRPKSDTRPRAATLTKASPPPPNGQPPSTAPTVASKLDETSNADYRLLSGLIERLPDNGKWSQAQRERWVQAFMGTLDFVVEMEEVVP